MRIILVVAGRDSKKRTNGMYIKTSRTPVRKRSRKFDGTPTRFSHENKHRGSMIFHVQRMHHFGYIGEEGERKESKLRPVFAFAARLRESENDEDQSC